MATVFTENMNRIDPSDTERSLTVLETYIRYMQERIEFASANMARSVSAAGVSSVEVAARLGALENTVSMLASVVNGYSARINGLETRIDSLSGTIEALGDGVEALGNTAGALGVRLGAAEDALAALDARVTALEH